MQNDENKTLLDELLHQLQLFQELYQVTASLAATCADEMPEQNELDRLLLIRQQLINESRDSQSKLQEIAADTNADLSAPVIKNILLEIRSVLEKTAFLNEGARKDLEGKRDLIKGRLFRLQSNKKAGAAYKAPVRQNEGFFIDSRKN